MSALNSLQENITWWRRSDRDRVDRNDEKILVLLNGRHLVRVPDLRPEESCAAHPHQLHADDPSALQAPPLGSLLPLVAEHVVLQDDIIPAILNRLTLLRDIGLCISGILPLYLDSSGTLELDCVLLILEV